jgi:predicted DNA-binding transcriptional regulator AlpA
MNDTGRILITLSMEEFEEIIERTVKAALNGHHQEDRLLDAKAAAERLCVSPDWLYRHAKKLPFTRKVTAKMLRFSSQGIQRYLASKKIS